VRNKYCAVKYYAIARTISKRDDLLAFSRQNGARVPICNFISLFLYRGLPAVRALRDQPFQMASQKCNYFRVRGCNRSI